MFIESITKNKSKWFVADFETTSKETAEQEGCTRVWLYAICDSDANLVALGSNIDDFMSDIEKLYGRVIYFHNLKFDGEFIISYLLSHDIPYYSEEEKERSGISAQPVPSFRTLIGEMGEFYGIDYKFRKNKNVHFKDSLKLLPFKVAKIAKDFGLPIQKEVIDYNDYTINEKTISYIKNDVRIVAIALKSIKEEGMVKATTAGCAYYQYSSMRNKQYMNDVFPELPDEFLEEWREAYRGGRSQVNPYYKGKELENVKRYDINSMYPAVMFNEELPYGLPIECTYPEVTRFNFYLLHVKIEFELKKDCLPSLLRKGALYAAQDTYYVSSEGIIELWLSSVDFELLERNYDIVYIEFVKCYAFRTTKLLFRDYINKWFAIKQSAPEGSAQRAVAKFMLNCLYGKFGSNYKGCVKEPYLDEDNIVHYRRSEEQQMKKYYLPVAIAITSYAHKYLDDAIHRTGITKFVYCDTDSVHTLGDLPKNMIDNTELGKFKLEAIEEKSKYVRQKTYITYEKGKYHITCAGLTDDMKAKAIDMYGDLIMQAFREGFEISGKLVPKHMKGGIVLHETTFRIQETTEHEYTDSN